MEKEEKRQRKRNRRLEAEGKRRRRTNLDRDWTGLKLWLFLAYVISFVSLAAAVGLLIQDALVETGPSAWTGTAEFMATETSQTNVQTSAGMVTAITPTSPHVVTVSVNHDEKPEKFLGTDFERQQ
ncbi:hypothetical protein HYC85_019972 [Camellia sinensis]|uniref:Uncharacterized protein n=1 Tax=Camellia sinensis TaxID=4442 RepID=A0A7J7GNR7_CAMSI|nr:hypothetical protein HYC85_019972 [Camellia sinensis]